MAETYLDTDSEIVTTSGSDVASTSGSWQSWATTCATAFGDAADAARNFALGSALNSYATEWNPTISQLASQVEALGTNVHTAAVAVEHGDVDSSQLVAAQHGSSGQQSTALNRPVNFAV